MNYEVLEALNQIAQEKNVDRALVIETLKVGLLSAAKKKFGLTDNIEVEVDPASGEIRVYALKEVVEEGGDPQTTIPLMEAQEIDPAAGLGSRVRELLNFQEFGRNAIQTAKQILVQRVREAERERIFDDFRSRVGEIVTGTVQQVSRGDLYINLGRTEALLPTKEQIRKEKYRQGDTVRAYMVDVLRTTKGPQVLLSRTHPKFLEKLFSMEVPEVSEGLVELKAVAREPGERSKIAVTSREERIDPVGACVGMKGARVQAIVRELSNERIDIVPWSQDEATFLSRALSPAKVVRVAVDRKDHRMVALVDPDQLSLAIGKSGQNARLAAQLTGWNIDIMTEEEYQDRLKERQATRVPLSEVPGLEEAIIEKLNGIGIESANDLAGLRPRDLTHLPDVDEALASRILGTAGGLVSAAVSSYRAARKAEKEAAALAKAEAEMLSQPSEADSEASKAHDGDKEEATPAEPEVPSVESPPPPDQGDGVQAPAATETNQKTE